MPKFQVAESLIHILTNLTKCIDQKSYFSNSSTCKMGRAPKVKVKEFQNNEMKVTQYSVTQKKKLPIISKSMVHKTEILCIDYNVI